MRGFAVAPCVLALLLAGGRAQASELFAGILAHAVDTPLTKYTGEGGADFELGWRSAPIAALRWIGRPSVHVLGSANSAGDTDFAAAGLDWKLPIGRFYVRPGIGIAVQDGPSRRVDAADERTDLGSRVLFEPEFSIGTAIAPRVALEASWVHLSHAQIFGPQNPGLDMIGARIALALP